MDEGCRYKFFIRIFLKSNSLIFLALNTFTRVKLYFFEIVVSSKSFFLKTRRNAFIVRLFNLTAMDMKKESKKHTPNVNAPLKTFLIDYIWANSKLVERK